MLGKLNQSMSAFMKEPYKQVKEFPWSFFIKNEKDNKRLRNKQETEFTYLHLTERDNV